MFFKVGVLKNFENFIGKHHCWSIFRSRCSQLFLMVFLKILQYSQKSTLSESLFEKVEGVKACNFNKKWLLHRCFPVNLWWLLLCLFNNVAGLKTSNVIKKRHQHRCFPVKFLVKDLRTPFLQNTSGGCFWTIPGDLCGSLCGEEMLWSFSTSLS